MKLRIEIEEELMAKAKLLSDGLSEKEIIESALKLFVIVENQKKILELYGKIEIDESAYL
ncbi:MAG: hypothetical protein M3O71_08335 [Bacteroidota bacterium]|nr:hypothetical protein [Bacteroidota bacterium]